MRLTTRTTTEARSMRMHNPPHPGEVLRSLCLEPLGLTVSDTARALGVSRKTLSGIVNGRVGISPEMAVRLSLAFDTTAESWLNQQVQYDLWRAEKKRDSLRGKRLAAAEPKRCPSLRRPPEQSRPKQVRPAETAGNRCHPLRRREVSITMDSPPPPALTPS